MRNVKSQRDKLSLLLLFTSATMLLASCASSPDQGVGSPGSVDAAEIAQQKAEIAAQKAELTRREQALAQQLTLLESRQAGSDGSVTSQARGDGTTDGLLPSNPKPGECYAQVIVPPQFRVKKYQVERRAASSRIETIPARYERVSERVLAKPESKLIEVVPAQYEIVPERVLIKPATTRLEVVPAVYEEVETQVIVKPAYTEWKSVTEIDADVGAGFASAGQTIERFGDFRVLETRGRDAGLMCLVEIPATTKIVKKTVLKTPATTRKIQVPAEYKDVMVTREVRPASTREVVIPAEFENVMVTKLVEPEREREIAIAAEMDTETIQEKTSDARIEWRPVLCKVNMTRENVSALQTALTATGECKCGVNRKVCPADGLMGRCTLNAVRRYADKQGLAYGDNYVTIDVIRSLGLKF